MVRTWHFTAMDRVQPKVGDLRSHESCDAAKTKRISRLESMDMMRRKLLSKEMA